MIAADALSGGDAGAGGQIRNRVPAACVMRVVFSTPCCDLRAMRGAFREWVLHPRRDRVQRQAKNCPITLASDRAKPSPRVCLYAGSSLAPREAGGAKPLRRDGHCPNTG